MIITNIDRVVVYYILHTLLTLYSMNAARSKFTICIVNSVCSVSMTTREKNKKIYFMTRALHISSNDYIYAVVENWMIDWKLNAQFDWLFTCINDVAQYIIYAVDRLDYEKLLVMSCSRFSFFFNRSSKQVFYVCIFLAYLPAGEAAGNNNHCALAAHHCVCWQQPYLRAVLVARSSPPIVVCSFSLFRFSEFDY